MNLVRKCLKPSLSKPHPATTSTGNRSPQSSPQVLTHDALLLPPPAPAEEAEDGYLLVEEDTTDSTLRRRKRKLTEEEEEEEKEVGVEVEIDRQLDQSLETKSKQHNLTTVNVRNIIHEVITNEHVVAMMKAAINETEAVPPFEPKMTRSKFKEVVEKGVVIPAWNISPIKKTSDVSKPPQFVDIPLAEEDSSDEEYHPDEEEEDETAEDVRTAAVSDWNVTWILFRADKRCWWSLVVVVKATRDSRVSYSDIKQPMSESEHEVGLMAYRTRSKRPLRDVPLGRLEAELRAPDITPDMYDSSSGQEDREWTGWLRGLMSSDMDNEEECDDEDDPEYNFLADIDEPDLEDYRDDKAVRITSQYTLKTMACVVVKPPVSVSVCLSQHVQLLTQVHLLTSPVARLHSEAETTRQFLVTHIPCNSYKKAELAWIFATRPVFLYPGLLPCASLDPALYCPRRTAAFTAAEDCLLVLGLRNMEGSCDPTKLVSQFLLRKTLVQVRRRILQCCRPGFPDNIAFRYQQVVWPMPVACSPVDPAERRPPVEREERVMPLWLVVGDKEVSLTQMVQVQRITFWIQPEQEVRDRNIYQCHTRESEHTCCMLTHLCS
uniref:Uncharacterized protein n=1 Tax=Monopterus albus TaxID=43700 RepID=A0A3Q3JCV1_MONAL